MGHHAEDTDYCGCGRVGYCTPRCPDPPRAKPAPIFDPLREIRRFLAPPTVEGLLATYNVRVVRRILSDVGGGVAYEALDDVDRFDAVARAVGAT